jgi:hypothetical protein
MSNHTNAQLSALATIVAELRKRTPQALAHAHNIVADGYPTLGGSGGHGGKNSISDPTANAALNRTTGTGSGYRVADQVQLLEHSLRIAAAALGDCLTIVDRLQPRPGDTPRCSGGAGLDGAHGPNGWGDERCENIPDGRASYLGMCNACAQRRYRWERSEPRTGTAA